MQSFGGKMRKLQREGSKKKSMENLPPPIFCFLGSFLELKDIASLLRVCKTFTQRDTIFFHWTRTHFPTLLKLPEEFESWRGFVREAKSLRWQSILENVILSKQGREISCRKGWSSVYTNLSFSSGKHYVVFKATSLVLHFLGVSHADTPLDSPCFGDGCFAHSPSYRDYRYLQHSQSFFISFPHFCKKMSR